MGDAETEETGAPVSSLAPAGGYGSAPPSKRFGPEEGAKQEQRRSLRPLVIVGLVIATLSTLGVVGFVGIRRYIAVAKTAEVRTHLADIAAKSAAAYELQRRVCPSASAPVPEDRSAISGRKYQSQSHEWRIDERENAGFACLRFQIDSFQYFQYSYTATASSYVARGRGDLNGNGIYSDFSWAGHVAEGRMLNAAEITEQRTEE